MKLRLPVAWLFWFAVLLSGGVAAEPAAGRWTEATWNGERAFAAISGTWKAVVSVDRGRLIYFGAASAERNLLFAPSTRDTADGWGGHRVWCGPQDRWPGGWPPPEAWEHSAAAAEADGSRLTLVMPESPDGWPRITREYFWDGGALHCRVRLTGGRRDAQIIQIVQVPASAAIDVRASRTAKAPRGYVQVHLGRKPSPRYDFPMPAQVTADGDSLKLKFTGTMEKLGFVSQPLRARIAGATLTVSRGASDGSPVGTPDDGYLTQVYLGTSRSALIELEQLSPLWRGGSEAVFEMMLKPE
jgi:hypothetical protein